MDFMEPIINTDRPPSIPTQIFPTRRHSCSPTREGHRLEKQNMALETCIQSTAIVLQDRLVYNSNRNSGNPQLRFYGTKLVDLPILLGVDSGAVPLMELCSSYHQKADWDIGSAHLDSKYGYINRRCVEDESGKEVEGKKEVVSVQRGFSFSEPSSHTPENISFNRFPFTSGYQVQAENIEIKGCLKATLTSSIMWDSIVGMPLIYSSGSGNLETEMESLIDMEQISPKQQISKQFRHKNRKYHKLMEAYPHTADPPISQYSAVPAWGNQALSYIFKHQRNIESNLQNSALAEFVRATAITAQELILEAYKQTIFVALARAYITEAALHIYHLLKRIFTCRLRTAILSKSATMEGAIEQELKDLFPEIFPEVSASHPEDSDLFDQWINPDACYSPPVPLTVNSFPLPPAFSCDSYAALIFDEADIPYTLCALPTPPAAEVATSQTESCCGSSESTPITSPEGSASPKLEPPRTTDYCPYPNCNKGPFRRPCDLKKHRKTHEKTSSCAFPGCDRAFASEKDRKRHHNTIHARTAGYKCPHCEKEVSRRDNLKDHIRRIHPNGLR